MPEESSPTADHLQSALNCLREGGDEIQVPCPISNRAAYLLFSLFTYLSRLSWMKQQVDQNALSGGTTATLIAINMNTVGFLKGDRNWEYELFGLELWLKNVVTGDVVGRLDALDDHYLVFEDFLKWLASLNEPCFATSLLLTLHPSTPSMRLPLAELSANGLLEQDFPHIWVGECCDHVRTEWDKASLAD